MRYCVDGHEFEEEYSDMLGDGEFPPFMVFDITAQDYKPEQYTSRAAAQVECDRLNKENE